MEKKAQDSRRTFPNKANPHSVVNLSQDAYPGLRLGALIRSETWAALFQSLVRLLTRVEKIPGEWQNVRTEGAVLGEV